MPLVMTYALAHAIAMDAANARMRRHGRTTWNRADARACVEAFNRCLPEAHRGPGAPIPPARPVRVTLLGRSSDHGEP